MQVRTVLAAVQPFGTKVNLPGFISSSRFGSAGAARLRTSYKGPCLKALELWGGAECTVNRVGDSFGDQLAATGHDLRLSDIELFAELGLDAVRFPLLWERISPGDPEQRDWSWSDPRLARLQELGIRPIAGLVHHGSGPRHTSLIDDNFADGLAVHARAVAERYPWIEEWTPVNEPLTTARFAALYGHWYPHVRDERLFWTALLNQIDAVRLSMRAIREVVPHARLVQTDDLGRTYATGALADQAAFDNVRRWMGWDLLFGRVTPRHDLWRRLCSHGLEDRLRAIADDPCPPDVVGINHYLTSDRFLDHRIGRYPPTVRGGNTARSYADVEAVRVLEPPAPGLRGVIQETWERYGRPVAITEVHNGCTREEQLRWIHDAWQVAHDAREQGVDVRAITAWALFGNRGWNTLLTAPGVYEPGAYDVSSGKPRETAVARLLRGLAAATPQLPALQGAGWWRRDIRLHHPTVTRPARLSDHPADLGGLSDRRPVMIAGATGTLGQALAAACRHRDINHVLTGRAELDLHDRRSIADALDRHRPWVVINAAGWVRVDDAEHEAEACHAANAEGAIALARACAERGAQSVSFSSDLVFDGSKSGAYVEGDCAAPLNVYGASKARMEDAIGAMPGHHLIVRTAAFFSPFDPHNFAVHAAAGLGRGERFRAAADSVVTPTYVPDLCNAVLDLAIDEANGIWHLSNGEALSWAEFAVRVAQACGLDPSLIDAVPGEELGWTAARPAQCALGSERGTLMPSLDSALRRFAEHVQPVSLAA